MTLCGISDNLKYTQTLWREWKMKQGLSKAKLQLSLARSIQCFESWLVFAAQKNEHEPKKRRRMEGNWEK